MKDRHLICIGKMTGPHGVRGEVKLLPYLEDASFLSVAQKLYGPAGEIFPLISVRRGPKDFFLLKMEGVDTREGAETYKDQKIFIDRQALPDDLEEEMFYIEDLIGLKAIVVEGDIHPLQVVAVHNFGAGDILEIRAPEKGVSYFVPFRKEAVPEVCPKKGVLKVHKAYLLDNRERPTQDVEG